MTQKDAVFNAVSSVLDDSNIDFEPGTTDVGRVLTRELRARINNILVEGFTTGSIPLAEDSTSKLQDASELKAYVSGLVSNWTRKDPRLNGGATVPTVAAKSHSKDPQLKALRALLVTKTDPTDISEVQSFIDARLSELNQ
jgi:hypothetical protein